MFVIHMNGSEQSKHIPVIYLTIVFVCRKNKKNNGKKEQAPFEILSAWITDYVS